MQRATRRRLLGAVGIGALAGCLEAPTSGSPGTGDEDGRDSGYPKSVSSDGGLRSSCPGYGDDVDRVVCYDAADLEAEPAFLEPSARTVEPGSSIAFTLHNGADERLATNFYDWRVDKCVDGEWYRVAPMAYNQPLMYVEPGGAHTWTATPDNEGVEAGARVGPAGGTDELSLEGVGAGFYAFRARGWFEGSRDEGIVAFAATFELEGEPVVLTPTDAVEDVEWEGDTLVARSNRGEPDADGYRLGAYELEVVDAPSTEPRTVITEGVLRRDRLRDAIALAHDRDASTVRLEEYDATRPLFGHDGEVVYEYQGAYYAVRTRELEE